MTTILWNGEFRNAEEPLITIDNRGFRYGDLVFETIRVHNRKPYLLCRHLDRLASAASTIGLDFNRKTMADDIANFIDKLVQKNGILRICLSRLGGGNGYTPRSQESECLIEWLTVPPRDSVEADISDYRAIPTACLPTEIKSSHMLYSILSLLQSQRKGMEEAMTLTMDGKLSSFASGNLFWKSGGAIHTPPLRSGCLPGITRGRLLELWPQIQETEADVEILKTADALIMTNSARLAIAVTAVRNVAVFPESESLAEEWHSLLLSDMANSA